MSADVLCPLTSGMASSCVSINSNYSTLIQYKYPSIYFSVYWSSCSVLDSFDPLMYKIVHETCTKNASLMILQFNWGKSEYKCMNK